MFLLLARYSRCGSRDIQSDADNGRSAISISISSYAVFRSPDVSFAFTRSRFRFHSRPCNTFACAESRERPDHRNEVQSLSCISRTSRCMYVCICAFDTKTYAIDRFERTRAPVCAFLSLVQFFRVLPSKNNLRISLTNFEVDLFLGEFPGKVSNRDISYSI